MAGGLLLVHGEAGRQANVLQIMERATQINTSNFSKNHHKTPVNTYSERWRRQKALVLAEYVTEVRRKLLVVTKFRL